MAEQGEQRVRGEGSVVQLETDWLSHVQPCRPLFVRVFDFMELNGKL